MIRLPIHSMQRASKAMPYSSVDEAKQISTCSLAKCSTNPTSKQIDRRFAQFLLNDFVFSAWSRADKLLNACGGLVNRRCNRPIRELMEFCIPTQCTIYWVSEEVLSTSSDRHALYPLVDLFGLSAEHEYPAFIWISPEMVSSGAAGIPEPSWGASIDASRWQGTTTWYRVPCFAFA
jgi:hypothetical protein